MTRRPFINILRPWARSFPMAAAEPTHLAVAGLSYCGSTLVSTILGNLPGVMNVGESHWLTDRRETYRTLPADFENVDYGRQHHCRQCGEDCTVFSREFRMALEKNPRGWYDKIQARLGGGFMVSSDKNLSKLKRLDPDLRMHLLVLFRSPDQNARSYLTNEERKPGGPPSGEDLRKYLDDWTLAYKRLIACKNKGEKIFLNFESFASSPEAHLQKICSIFDLRFDASVVTEPATNQHYFGGNQRVARMLRNNDQKIKIDPIEKPSFTDEYHAIVDRHGQSRAMFDGLMKRYDERFEPAKAHNGRVALTEFAGKFRRL